MGELVTTLQIGGWGVAAVALWALRQKDAAREALVKRLESAVDVKDIEIARLNGLRVDDAKEVRSFTMSVVEKQATLLTQVGDVMREVTRAK